MFNSGAKNLNQNKCWLIKYLCIGNFFENEKFISFHKLFSFHCGIFHGFFINFFSDEIIVVNALDNGLCTASINDDGGGDGGDFPVVYTISHVAYLSRDFHRYYELLTSDSRTSTYFRFKNEVTTI